MQTIRLTDIPSTNDYLLSLGTDSEVCAVADYQSAGKGMGGNTWESERGKNLLFSILIHPTWLPVHEQYLLSMAEALALHDALSEVLGDKDGTRLTIKWPNDIYWDDLKLSGTRIDANIQGGKLHDFVIGTGINVNQREFRGTAPNPVSMWQILRSTVADASDATPETDRDALLSDILLRFEGYAAMLRNGGRDGIIREYHARLYRREGYHRYADGQREFMARLVGVAANGIMTLQREDGELQRFDFKEVSFVHVKA